MLDVHVKINIWREKHTYYLKYIEIALHTEVRVTEYNVECTNEQWWLLLYQKCYYVFQKNNDDCINQIGDI